MLNDHQTRIHELEDAVASLTAENLALRKAQRNLDQISSVSGFTFAFLAKMWLGPNLRVATTELGNSLQNWQATGTAPPIKEIVNLFGAIVARFTRVGIFRISVAAAIAIGTLWFGVAQVLLLSNQNRLLE